LVHERRKKQKEVHREAEDANSNVKYLYYYMDFIQDKIQKLANYCTNNGNIDMKKLMTVKIPIPTLEKQKEIVTQCEFNDNLIKQLEEEIENNKKQAQEFIMNVLTKKEEPELQDGSGGGKPVAVVSDSEDEEKPEPVIVKKKSSKNNKAAAISDSEDEE
jgi:restriction endonuclease S subunit